MKKSKTRPEDLDADQLNNELRLIDRTKEELTRKQDLLRNYLQEKTGVTAGRVGHFFRCAAVNDEPEQFFFVESYETGSWRNEYICVAIKLWLNEGEIVNAAVQTEESCNVEELTLAEEISCDDFKNGLNTAFSYLMKNIVDSGS
jgi:hypothetical protein